MSATIPGGNNKGVPLAEADTRDIKYWIDRKSQELEQNPNGQHSTRDVQWCKEARAELERRQNGGQRPPRSGNGVARRTTSDEATKAVELYAGAHDNAKNATEALAKIQEIGHLISPAPACATLPEGCSILISAIQVDNEMETYPVPGGRGLGKTALQKLGAALGVSWDHAASGRIDDVRDPHFVEYLAVGRVRNFDGTWREITGRKVMDLRDGSPTVQALQQRSEGKASRENAKVKDWQSQLRDLRYFILEHAETKAQLRAIRSLGLRTSYKQDELAKPFFTAQIQFTGRSDDPEIRRMFADRIADSFMGQAVPTLYGRPQTQRPARPAQHPRRTPAFTELEDDDPIETYGEPVDDPYGPDGVPVSDCDIDSEPWPEPRRGPTEDY